MSLVEEAVGKATEVRSRLYLFGLFHRQKMLTEISSLAYSSSFFQQTYSKKDEELWTLIQESFPAMMNNELTRLDAVLALSNNNYCDTCLEEEGNVWGYRSVSPITTIVLREVISVCSDYDMALALTLTCKEINKEMNSSVEIFHFSNLSA